MIDLSTYGHFLETPSLVWGVRAGIGAEAQAVSPYGDVINRFRLLSEEELRTLFTDRGPVQTYDLSGSCERLIELLNRERIGITETMRRGTGFNERDCQEMFEGAIQLLQKFEAHHSPLSPPIPYENRAIRLARSSWGTVAVILPQNAFLVLGLTALLAGLAAGNRVILRAPSVEVRSAAYLGKLLLEAGFDPDSFSIVVSDSRQFVSTLCESPEKPLLHFLGSSRNAAGLFGQTFAAGCPIVLDGDGNVWVYVDQDFDAEEAADLLWQGTTRYAGQTCTSVNGVVAHPLIADTLRSALRERFASREQEVGRLSSEDHANRFDEAIRASGGRLGRAGNLSRNFMPPTLVEDPDWRASIVVDGMFAPAMWIKTGDYDEFRRRWKDNRFPLSAGIMSHTVDAQTAANDLGRVSRIVMNGDPSIEYVLEPWGGYPGSGANPVGPWIDKYSRIVQIDAPQ